MSRIFEFQSLAFEIADRAREKFTVSAYEGVRSAFLAVDSKGNGKLTIDEALAFCKVFNLSPEQTERFFELLDHHETDWKTFLSTHAPVFKEEGGQRLRRLRSMTACMYDV